MFRKTVVVGLVALFVGLVGINAPVAQAAPDACGQAFVYEKTSDFSDSRVIINFESGDQQIDVSANLGYAITKVELDVQNDGRSGYYTYATGPLNNFNPNPGNGIDAARVTVNKMCESTLEACSDGLDNDGDSAIDLADTGCVAFKPTLTVTKVVSGGSKVIGDFTLRVCPTTPDVSLLERLFGVRSALAVVDPCVTVTSGQATILVPGWYQVSETPVADYTGAFTGGSCGSNGKLYIGVGDAKTCQLTNTFVPPPVVDVCPNLDGTQESLPSGYQLVDGSCQVIPQECGENCATVIATKIVCDNEADLPNWGAGDNGPITATTASDWVASHEGCRLASGWQFQYADQNGTNPGDTFLGEAGAPYTTTAMTNEIGQVSWQMVLDSVTEIHVREVLQEGYLPFSFGAAGNNSNDVSAELYCTNDAENYDNFDFIYAPQADQTYSCVAWNALTAQVEPEPTSTEPVNILVETGPATGIATSTATLNGTVTPNGHLTDWYFEYGTDGIALSVSTTVQSAGDGLSAAYVSSSLAELMPNTNYFYRIVGTSGGTVVIGSVQSFWTDAVHNTGGGDNLPPTPPTGGGEVLGTSTASSTPPTTGGGENAGGQVLGASTCGVYLNDHLRRGWKNNDPEEVKKLQSFLNEDLGLQLPMNGFFGTMTEQAVRDFQTKYHGEVLKPWVPYGLLDEMTPTGYVYKTTRRWINMVKCHELELPLPQLP